MSGHEYGKILLGQKGEIERLYGLWENQSVDLDLTGEDAAPAYSDFQTTLKQPFSVTGPGTFFGQEQRKLTFEPAEEKGWWFNRTDLSESMPISVSVNNVWTTVRNIVLCSGSPHNYMRMVEHIIALKLGLGLDNVVISMDSGDPPLFDRSSMDLVEGVQKVGMIEQKDKAVHLSVKEPVTVCDHGRGFLTLLPDEKNTKKLFVDCAVDFNSAIGKQRIKFVNSPKMFTHGALARTNCAFSTMVFCKTIGMIFADTRNIGYTPKNILIAGKRRYYNEPKLMHGEKSLEAVWHRATLDLLAALALADRGRIVGKVISYRAGHSLDVQMVRELYQRDLLVEV